MTSGELPEPILRRVRALIAARRYDEALLDLHLAEDSAEVRNLIGVVFLKRRRYKRAEEHFRRALELDPDHFEAVNNLGLAVSRQRGRRREAIDIFLRAAELRPEGSVAGQNLTEATRNWLAGAGLVASWIIFRIIRTAWMEGNWQGLWSPWVVAWWSVVTIAVTVVVVLKRRRDLPRRAREMLDAEAARTRRETWRNGVFDGLLIVVFFGGMFWAIERYEVLQQSMALRAVMFAALLAVGVAIARLFRRLTGSA
jgi:tetratricopeptide (TPR) repeat protein